MTEQQIPLAALGMTGSVSQFFDAMSCDEMHYRGAVQSYFVYIMASRSRRLYTGMTRDLGVRVWQHRDGQCNHTQRYRIHRLVYFARFSTPTDAIAAEKRIKAWTRAKRVALIESVNPLWRDFAEGWLGKTARHPERSEGSAANGGTSDPSLRSG